MITDPIADMLTMIRNAKSIYRADVTIPHSKIKEGIVSKLKQEGYINNFEVLAEAKGCIKIQLKYGPDGEQIIRKIFRVSKPGRRVYRGLDELKKIIGGLGTAIVSTSKGILTDRECREKKIGGEVICILW